MLSAAPQLSSLRRVLLSFPPSSSSSQRVSVGRSGVRHRTSSASASGSAVGPSADAASYRVLAFEDSYNIKAMLRDADVRYGHFEQRWTSHSPIEAMEEFGEVDVLLLDYYLPPMTGFKARRPTTDPLCVCAVFDRCPPPELFVPIPLPPSR